MTSVILVAKAAQQLQEIDAWWRAHRPDAVTLVADEFERCVELLENTPALGAPFRKTSVFGVRRLVMKKTKHLVYYVHDSAHSAPAGLPDGEVDLCLADPDDEMKDDGLLVWTRRSLAASSRSKRADFVLPPLWFSIFVGDDNRRRCRTSIRRLHENALLLATCDRLWRANRGDTRVGRGANQWFGYSNPATSATGAPLPSSAQKARV